MKVVVCIKQVPGTNSRMRIDPNTGTVVWDGEERIINPLDMYALEEGLRIKEQHGGTVTALSMGTSQAEEILRESIGMGVGQCFLISDSAFNGSDTLATSYILSKAMEKIEQFDIVICGKQALDGDTGQVGAQLAELLGLPFISYVSHIEEIREGYMRAQRMVEDGHQIVEMTLPGVISVVKEINEPRLPSLRGLMQSKKAQIPVWGARELGVDINKVGLSGSPTRVVDFSIPGRAAGGELLQGSPESQVEQLLEKLKEVI